MRCACAILPSVVCPVVPYFSMLSYKRHDFRKNVIEKKMCGLIFCTNLSEIFLIPRRTVRDIIINLHSSLSKVTHMFARFS